MLFQNSNSGSGVVGNATQITDVAWQSINNLLTGIVERLPFIIAGILVATIFFLFAKLVRKVFLATTTRAKLDERLRILFSRLIVVAIAILGVFTAFTVIVPSFGFGDLIAGVGFTTFVIGFATKDILNNLLSGVLILWQQPFRTGDYIFVDKVEGWVQYIGVRATSLRKSNGEVILIPNGDIYSSPFKIRRAGASYPMSLKFAVGYKSNIKETKELTRDALLASGHIANEPPPKVVITDLSPGGILFTANFRINSNENRPLEVFDEAASRVLDSLSDAGIEVYPPESTIVLRSDIEAAASGNGSRTKETVSAA